MKVIQNGFKFNIYDDDVQTHDQLPAQAYIVQFNPMAGPSLRKYSDIEVNEKVYGIHEIKAEKVLRSFGMVERNLGVILSGDKGIGKSLFSKVLAMKAIESGLPLIVVNSYFPGISEFLNEIKQEVMILFDEFDKTFSNIGDGEAGAQAEMLTLFDGIAQGKKLFCVTCNDLHRLSTFLVNRPGRFHYHFRFEYPTAEEIHEYLADKLMLDEKTAAIETNKVVHFAQRTKLNFDCLRAIAFELNLGLPFEEAIKDLNILQTGGDRFNLKLKLGDGRTLVARSVRIDAFSDDEVGIFFKDPDKKEDVFYVKFVPNDSRWSSEVGCSVIVADDLTYEWEHDLKEAFEIRAKWKPDEENDELPRWVVEDAALYDEYKDAKPMYLEMNRVHDPSLHYSL